MVIAVNVKGKMISKLTKSNYKMQRLFDIYISPTHDFSRGRPPTTPTHEFIHGKKAA